MIEIKDILLNDIHTVNNTTVCTLPTKNGMLDPLHVEVRSGMCIAEALHNVNNLVNVTQGYPKNSESKVTFAADLVVMEGREYRRLIELLELL